MQNDEMFRSMFLSLMLSLAFLPGSSRETLAGPGSPTAALAALTHAASLAGVSPNETVAVSAPPSSSIYESQKGRIEKFVRMVDEKGRAGQLGGQVPVLLGLTGPNESLPVLQLTGLGSDGNRYFVARSRRQPSYVMGGSNGSATRIYLTDSDLRLVAALSWTKTSGYSRLSNSEAQSEFYIALDNLLTMADGQ